MRAAWYDRQGPARDVLVVGELPDPEPGPGEVRIAVAVSGLSPGDTKKRSGWQGSAMPYPRVVPHSDGAGVVDAVGEGVSRDRIGRPVWCFGAQSYRPYGTAAELVVVPEALAVDLPDGVSREVQEQAACLGIAGITAHRSVFADGSVDGLVVLVHGATGGVGSIATQLAVRDGATVLAVVRDDRQVARARELGAAHVFRTGDPGLAAAVREVAPDGVHRISEVDLAAHADLDAAVLALDGVVCSYATSADRTALPYWPLAFGNAVLRLLGSDDFPPAVKAEAASTLTAALVDGTLRSTIAERVPLAEVARAHDLVDRGVGGRVVLEVT